MSQSTSPPRDFFVAGGTLRHDAPSYVVRPADDELYRLVRDGRLCYVLTTRQMGKSSLMNRLGRRLRSEGVATALLDLTAIGTAGPEAWYLSLLDDVQLQLGLETDAETWWAAKSHLSPVRRFTRFVSEVVLDEAPGPVALFVDEVDSALTLPFSDDFFAAVRALHNQTLGTADAGRLAIVLLGVATPNELIRGTRRTPFNVGEPIDLEELDLGDARTVFARGLPEQDPALIEQLHHWTGGHPYLMQRVCHAVAREPDQAWTPERVDGLVAELFFTERARREESNLQFVGGRLLASPRKEELLRLYQQIRDGRRPVRSDRQDPLQAELKLIGLVKATEDGYLAIRNRVYREVFDGEWIARHRPVRRRRLAAALLLVTALAIVASVYFWHQAQRSDDLLAETYMANFAASENPTLRLDNLARLIALEGYDDEARALFATLPAEEQAALFAAPTADLQPQVERVVDATYVTLGAEALAPDPQSTRVLAAMAAALARFQPTEDPALLAEIESWVQARGALVRQEPEEARLAYSVALRLNENNPAVRFERALVAAALAEYAAAAADLALLLEEDPPWPERVGEVVNRNPALQAAILADGETLPRLAALVPTLQPPAEPALGSAPTEAPAPAATAEPVTMEPRATATTEPAEPPLPTADSVEPAEAVLLEAPPAVSVVEPAGLIIYTCFTGGVDQICAVRPDGTGAAQVVESPATDWTPSLAPGGTHVLFSSARSGTFGLYEVERAGGAARLLIPPRDGDYSPVVSPGGEKIAFTRAEAGRQNIWVMDRDGFNARPLTAVEGDAIDPTWSPDGAQIAFSRRRAGEEGYTLVIMNADGSDPRPLPLPLEGIGGRSDWSPDGRWLAFHAGSTGDHDLYLVRTDGSAYVPVTDGGDNLGPAFSPDGNWLVFTSGRDGDNELYLIRLDGTGLIRLTDNSATDWQPYWGE